MRTTLRIDDTLLAAAKLRAARSGRTVGEVVEDALRESLSRGGAEHPVIEPLPVFGGSGVRPGIDLTDMRSLRDALDDGTPLHALR